LLRRIEVGEVCSDVSDRIDGELSDPLVIFNIFRTAELLPEVEELSHSSLCSEISISLRRREVWCAEWKETYACASNIVFPESLKEVGCIE
jgi:hypothetical protein